MPQHLAKTLPDRARRHKQKNNKRRRGRKNSGHVSALLAPDEDQQLHSKSTSRPKRKRSSPKKLEQLLKEWKGSPELLAFAHVCVTNMTILENYFRNTWVTCTLHNVYTDNMI